MVKAFLALGFLLLASFGTQAGTVCTLIADPQTRAVLLAEGDCETRVTPASTFKLPLAAMGFDVGFLRSAHDPVLPFKQGYPEWGGGRSREDTDPTLWLENSTVWYSQRITEALGAEKLAAYAQAFGYGNLDFTGEPGENNGLERSWISSSLKISPLEQAGFVAALVTSELPVSAPAHELTRSIVEVHGSVDNWTIRGKTGSGSASGGRQSGSQPGLGLVCGVG